jgi:predicted amino acid racemase
MEVISGGGTSSLMVTEAGEMPAAVNQIRVGEGILLGTDATFARSIPWLHQDTFILRAEIVELKSKPTRCPSAHAARRSSTTPLCWRTRGRASARSWRWDSRTFRPAGSVPFDPELRILGASSDHMILDIEDSARVYAVGDMIDLRLNYQGLLMACSSAYIPQRLPPS